MVTNGAALDCVEIVNKCGTMGGHLDVDNVGKDLEQFGDNKDRLRCLFDLVLSGYLKEVTWKGLFRPMPAMLGNDGQSLDLLKLFLVVREIGGYELVSNEGLWAFVVKELGLGFQVLASVKLIYAKYLYELEKWLRSNLEDRKEDNACGGNFGFLTLEQEKDFRGLFANRIGRQGVVNKVALIEYRKHKKFIGKDSKNGVGVSDTNSRFRLQDRVGKVYGDDAENECRKEFSTRKRKRKSLSEMLSWVMLVAKCHDDPSVREILEPSKWINHKGDEFWIQAIRAREALRQKRDGHSVIEQSPLQKNQEMHPSMYDDDFLNHHFTEKLRCSERLSRSNSCSCSHCSSGSTFDSQLMCLHRTHSECGPKELSSIAIDLSSLDTSMTVEPYGDDIFRRQVAVGPRFQAEVPEWTGPVSDSDSKWLGTRQWPLSGGEYDSLAITDPIGSRQPNSCSCQIPNSVECIRFHIAENRMKLKLELGSLFYHWRFDGMGEEVSLRWTAEEEKKFKHMVQLESPSLNAFWPRASEFFPEKTWQDLISYYFNVFLIRRRSYQNRVTPKSIDSDDDESEFGCISDSFGSYALKESGTSFHSG
ncbi:AT-rich interactive domain-containing protein 2 isoform X2 [Hibiscus syriacus]|uniref:AT-rich interactive domain-containing protein 2 isoform X2 n=1 Tax=Hibiscus syriacus TaxID=106335 RepID=UPI001920F72F|nr:AT-rich interactive domain-containing protein 2 isoform X2 [Hibiscus syriacus]